MLSRYVVIFTPVVEIVCCLVMSAQVVEHVSPTISSRDRVLSRYVSPVVEIVCCLVMSAQ